MSVPAYQIIQNPIITEESQIQATKGAQYTFRVAASANKRQIADAVEEVFPDVKVTRVNTMNYGGKLKRQMGRRTGKTSKWKKAIVTLRQGDTIDLI